VNRENNKKSIGSGVTRNEATGDIYMVLPFIEFDLDRSINAISDHLTTAQVSFTTLLSDTIIIAS